MKVERESGLRGSLPRRGMIDEAFRRITGRPLPIVGTVACGWTLIVGRMWATGLEKPLSFRGEGFAVLQ